MKALLTSHGHSPAFEGLSLVDDALRTFDRMWRTPAFSRAVGSAWSGGPEFSVESGENGWTLRAEVPGLGAENLEVEVHGDRLTVRGRRDIEVPEGFRALRRERAQLGFERSFEFGRSFDPEGVKAELKLGVLTISVPKPAEEKPRTITIASA